MKKIMNVVASFPLTLGLLFVTGELPDCSTGSCSCEPVGKCKPCSRLDIVRHGVLLLFMLHDDWFAFLVESEATRMYGDRLQAPLNML